jgi:hypothetical protein
MFTTLARIALASLTIACGSVSTTTCVQAQSPAKQVCPASYWLMGTLCLNRNTGDVVLASTPNRVALAGCRPGYWRQDALCFGSATGDVELADDQRWAASQRAEVRK